MTQISLKLSSSREPRLSAPGLQLYVREGKPFYEALRAPGVSHMPPCSGRHGGRDVPGSASLRLDLSHANDAPPHSASETAQPRTRNHPS